MSIFVIGDLHLSFNEDKPMDIFGENWKNHEEKIKKDWEEKVKEQDLVIIPGDFSWSMELADTKRDFEYLDNLPGKKILLKGNHDYWWNTITKMRNFLKDSNFDNIDFIYNNSYEFEDKIIVGTRGWNLNGDEKDNKIVKRELTRLELSIKDGINKYGDDKEIIVFMHYPPITNTKIISNERLDFLELMKKYNIKKCYYGHIHGVNGNFGNDFYEGIKENIEFKLVSADYVDFKLVKIC